MGLTAPVDEPQAGISKRLRGAIVWNLASFAIMGAAGIALNSLIALLYDPGVLGVFNEVYAVYILLSQLAVAGIHLSVLKHASSERESADHILHGAIIATLVVAVPVAAIGFAASGAIGDLMKSGAVASGLRHAMAGILLFAINKVLLAFHNGLERMRAFAVFQSLRFIMMIAWLCVLAALHYDKAGLPLIFTLAEGGLFVALAVYTSRHHASLPTRAGREWARRHFRFGATAMWGNLLADVNTRVDILLLGFFATDATVGIYSFAALIAEGFSQLAIVFRNIVNPQLARYASEGRTDQLATTMRRGIVMTYKFTLPFGLALAATYPITARILGGGTEYRAGWLPFAILVVGITLSMGYSAFQLVLNQAGFPGAQSLFFGVTFVSNVILNLALIPSLGMTGSAIATGMSYVLSVYYFRFLVRRRIGIRI